MSDEQPDPHHSEEWGLLVDGGYETVPASTEADARAALEQRRDAGALRVQLVERRRCAYTHTTIVTQPADMAELDAFARRLDELEQRVRRLRDLHMPEAGGCRACHDPWPCQTRLLLDELYPQ